MEKKVEFYGQLEKVVLHVPMKHKLFLCGDFNARVGRSQKNEKWGKVLGNFGTGQLNENGSILLEFCSKHNLRICNTFFKWRYRGTWQHPRTKKWHQLDHILCRIDDSCNNMKCYVDTTAECWTDHQLVILKQRIQQTIERKLKRKQHHSKRHSSPNLKLSSEKLIRNFDLRAVLRNAIDQKLEKLVLSENYAQSSITSKFNSLSQAVMDSCSNILKPSKRKNAYWFDGDNDQLDKLLQIRREKYQKYLQHRTFENRMSHRHIQYKVQERLRNMENKFWET